MSRAAPDAGRPAAPNLAEAVRDLRREPGAALGAAAAVALSGAAVLPVLSLVRAASLDPPRVASALRPALDLGGLGAAGVPWSGAAVPPAGLALEGWEGVLGVLAAAAVLVVAASAVAAWSLLTGRTRRRGRELGVRAAMGARRRDLRRQLLAEGGLVAAAGAAAGLAAGLAGVGLVEELLAPALRRPAGPGPGWPAVVALAVPAAAALGAPAAAVPALRGSRGDALSPLRLLLSPARPAGDLLAAGQAGLALAVLVAAGLLVPAGLPAEGEGAGGLEPTGAVILDVELPGRDSMEKLRRARSLLAARPDTERVAYGSPGAWAGIGPRDRTLAECECSKGGGYVPVVAGPLRHAVVGPDFFRALGTPVLAGRTFRREDRRRARRVAVVTEAFERRRLGGSGAVGKWIRVAGGAWRSPPYEIVGVVEDLTTRTLSTTRLAGPTVFLPGWAHPLRRSEILVRESEGSTPEPAELAAAVSRRVPGIRVRRSAALPSLIEARSAPFRAAGGLLWPLVLVAVAVTALGVGGLAADEAWSRRPEVGLRRAVGARRRHAAGLVLGAALRPVAAGTAAGLILAVPVARGLAMLLDVGPARLSVWSAAAVLLPAVAAAAALGPALRAAREDPGRSLEAPWR